MPMSRDALRMDPDDLVELMTTERTLRVATVGPDGTPHVVPLWFAWHDDTIWVTSLRKSRRARDLAAGSPVSVCADTGHEYSELRGAVFYGRFEEAEGHEQLPAARHILGQKYWGIDDVPELRSHVWLRLAVDRSVTWDFRKMPSSGDRRSRAVDAARAEDRDE